MAYTLKTASILISPKFLSPISPNKFMKLPKSDGKSHIRRLNVESRPKVIRKLFTTDTKALPEKSKSIKFFEETLPLIKVEPAEGNTSTECKRYNLEINTPNKLNLAQHGLDHFKSRPKILGKGTFGTVFKGNHKGLDVAVKIADRETCRREHNALGLNHKNIIRIQEIIESSDQQRYSLVIMEYLPKCRNLQEVLVKTSSKEAPIRQYATDITMGLSYLHKKGIIHLDLKPKNILVDEANICKICDFGNSAKIADNFDHFKYNGTIIYTAPEILLGNKPTIKSDIYSLGLIFWQIRYREDPFQEFETVESIIYNIGKHDIRPIYQNSDNLAPLFTKCWESNPENRPTTEEILGKLKYIQL